jgi:hypothetical protein
MKHGKHSKCELGTRCRQNLTTCTQTHGAVGACQSPHPSGVVGHRHPGPRLRSLLPGGTDPPTGVPTQAVVEH